MQVKHDATAEWNRVYTENPLAGLPWYWDQLDSDLEEALQRHGISAGRILDQGTGPGTQALALAERGYTVTATDLSEAAIRSGTLAAQTRNLDVTFVQDDVLASRLTGPFDAVFDRGCFHGMPTDARDAYLQTMVRVLAPKGWLFLKTFSHLEPERGPRPRRYCPEEIRAHFGTAFELVETRDTYFQGIHDPWPRALFCTLRKSS